LPGGLFRPTFIEQETRSVISSSDGTVSDGVQDRPVNNPGAELLVESASNREWVNGAGNQMREERITRPLTDVLHYPFGFVAGCIWGDDSSDKVQYLDLSKADKGIIKREERFGYIELPPKIRLKDAIDMSLYAYDEEEYSNYIRLNIMQKFDLRTGEIPDPWDP
jgi:hypothetical protein